MGSRIKRRMIECRYFGDKVKVPRKHRMVYSPFWLLRNDGVLVMCRRGKGSMTCTPFVRRYGRFIDFQGRAN